jgi:hypothetical protein
VNTGSLRFTLIAACLLGLIMAVRVAVWPVVQITLPTIPTPGRGAHVEGTRPTIAPESVAAIASRDPFRIGRRPLLPAYDPLRLAEQLAPPPPRPALLLVGVIDGVNPSAVIEGFPGVEGSRIVRMGDVVAGLTIKKVGTGGVVISGMDTSWVLEVREPWKN